MKTAEKKANGLKPLVREWVEEALYEILGDPDEGQELKERVKARLKKSFVRRTAPGRSAREVARRLGLEW